MSKPSDIHRSVERMKLYMVLRGLRPNTISTFSRCGRGFRPWTFAAHARCASGRCPLPAGFNHRGQESDCHRLHAERQASTPPSRDLERLGGASPGPQLRPAPNGYVLRQLPRAAPLVLD
jgi:hypothetical protein